MSKILVIGLTRAGGGAILQMLDAAGIFCYGHPPQFDDQQISEYGGYHFDKIQHGEAGKCLVHDHPPAHIPWDYKVIFAFRHLPELHKSSDKWIRTMVDASLVPADPSYVLDSLERVHKELYASLQARKVIYLGIAFDELVTEPFETAKKIATFINKGNPALMAQQIVHRSPACYPSLLEQHLMGRKRITERKL